MRLLSMIFRALRISNDVNAVRQGRVGQRVVQRATRRTRRRMIRRMFK